MMSKEAPLRPASKSVVAHANYANPNVHNISIGTISLVDGYMEWTLHTFAQEVESSIDKSKMTVGSA